MTPSRPSSRKSSRGFSSRNSSRLVRPCPPQGLDRSASPRPAGDPYQGVPGRAGEARAVHTDASQPSCPASYAGLHDRRAARSPHATRASNDVPTRLPTTGSDERPR